MARAISLVLAIAIALLAVIWGVARFGPGETFHDYGPTRGAGRKTVICYKISEDVQVDGKVCVYMCEDGEKTRVDKLRTCLPRIEV